MGHPRGRIPGPLGKGLRLPTGGDLAGILRNLETEFPDGADQALNFALDASHVAGKVLGFLKDIYDSSNWPQEKKEESNFTQPSPAQLPGGREDDARRPAPDPGIALTNRSLALRLQDTEFSLDHETLTLKGKAKGTLELGTPYPRQFDSPTEIPITITSTSLSTSEIGVRGYATAYKVFRANFQLNLHYDADYLSKAVARLAKDGNIGRKDVEDMLAHMSFDASAIVKAGIPLSVVKLSASSLLPLRRPVLGALDDILPAQIAALPDRELFIGGLQAVPKGVFFDVTVPGLGAHYSKFTRDSGFAGTVAGLAKPDLAKLGTPSKAVSLFAYLDFQYAKRLTDTVDLNVGLTYTYTPETEPGKPDNLQFQYFKAKSHSWLPESRENLPPATDQSGHSLMFRVRGTFDAL
ncbi:MAG TPA: hypothetical protein VGL09_08970 [Methylomirabilota bacterium]|jgi:hypothetical protein